MHLHASHSDIHITYIKIHILFFCYPYYCIFSNTYSSYHVNTLSHLDFVFLSTCNTFVRCLSLHTLDFMRVMHFFQYSSNNNLNSIFFGGNERLFEIKYFFPWKGIECRWKFLSFWDIDIWEILWCLKITKDQLWKFRLNKPGYIFIFHKTQITHSLLFNFHLNVSH